MWLKLNFDETKCSILALPNAPIGAFCNARMLHLTLKCGETQKKNIFKIVVFWGFTVVLITSSSYKFFKA